MVNVQSNCDTSISNFSENLTFQTSGCGACQDLPYCEINSGAANLEWIANVTFNTLNNTTISNRLAYFWTYYTQRHIIIKGKVQ